MDFEVTPLNQPEPQPSWFARYKIKLAASLSLLLLLVAGSVYFFGRGGFSLDSVKVEVKGEQEIAAGELVTYKVHYENNNKVSLLNAKLVFFYPDDAVVLQKDGNISDSHSIATDLGTVTPGGRGDLEFQAYLVGDKGNIKTGRAVLSFSVVNISPVLEKEGTLVTTVTSLSVPMTLVAPPTIQSGQRVTYILDYRNQSPEDKHDLRVIMTYPGGFRPEVLSPRPTENDDTWYIPVLAQGEASRITVTGPLFGNERETKLISVVLQRKLATPSGEQWIDYESTNASTAIQSPTLSVDVMLNNSKDYIAHLSDRLQYSVTVKNNSNYHIFALNLSTKLEGDMFNFSTVRSDGFFDGRTNTIHWNSSSVPNFADFAPGQSVKVTFDVNVKDAFIGGAGTKDSFVKVVAHLETTSVPPELAADRLTADSELVTRISTAATFTQKLFIKDSVYGSQGPFPLKVDQKTAFYVHWILANPANDITGAKVTATLEPGVTWENVTRVNGSQPLPAFNSRTNSVTWNFITLPGGTGTTFPAYEAVFKLTVTPSVNQVGQAPKLLKDINFSGIDSFTKEKIQINVSNTTTSNVEDSDESGTVRP